MGRHPRHRGRPAGRRPCARVDGPLKAGAPYAIVSWPLGVEGRKRHAACTIFDAAARALASSREPWIELPRPVGRAYRQSRASSDVQFKGKVLIRGGTLVGSVAPPTTVSRSAQDRAPERPHSRWARSCSPVHTRPLPGWTTTGASEPRKHGAERAALQSRFAGVGSRAGTQRGPIACNEAVAPSESRQAARRASCLRWKRKDPRVP